MRKKPILTALNSDGQLIRIDAADRGERYMGATQDHEDCELYPVFRSTKQSSFAHLPSQQHVAAPLSWTLRNSSGVSEGVDKSVEQSDGEFLSIGVWGRQ